MTPNRSRHPLRKEIASPCTTRPAFSSPVAFRFSRMRAAASRRASTKVHRSAPRDRASIPSCPVPPNRSRTLRPSISNWMMLNRDSFTLSVVGRVSIPWSSFSLLPRAEPEITRMVTLPFSQPDPDFLSLPCGNTGTPPGPCSGGPPAPAPPEMPAGWPSRF